MADQMSVPNSAMNGGPHNPRAAQPPSRRLPTNLPTVRPTPATIAVLRALPGLGDFLCAVPALRALRAGYPHARITLIGPACLRPLAERFDGYVDELLPFPGYPGLSERAPDPSAVLAFYREAQRRHFDLALQMHGDGSVSNSATLLLGATVSAGFYPNGGKPHSSGFIPYPAKEPEVLRNLRLVASLGFAVTGTQLEFPLLEADDQALAQLLEAVALRGSRYVCIHPGASRAGKRRPVAWFAQVAAALDAQGFRVVITGDWADTAAGREIAAAVPRPVIDLTGKTSLGALAALLRGARLVVCNDTGASHLADALRTPSVVVFTESDVARWAPLDRARHRVVEVSSTAPEAAIPQVLAQSAELSRMAVQHVA